MKDIYSDPEHWATVNLWNYAEPFPELGIDKPFSLLARIEVNQAFRHSGFASRLLNLVLEDADEEQIVICLSVQPDDSPGSLTYAELVQWYARHGFGPTAFPGIMKRNPEA